MNQCAPFDYSKGIPIGLTYDGRAWLKGKRAFLVITLMTLLPLPCLPALSRGVRILSEAASAKIATPVEKQPEQLKPTRGGADPGQAGWNHRCRGLGVNGLLGTLWNTTK